MPATMSTKTSTKKFAAKKLFLTVAAAALLAPLLAPCAAQARNLEVETGLRSLGDLSDFYRALVYTGVANELQEGHPYTVLAPTNAALAVLNRENYPCFYMPQCHDAAAAFVRAHIIDGRYPIKRMLRHVRVETEGQQSVLAEEPFIHQDTFNDQNVLSEADVGNSVIYRLDGILVPPADLGVFRTASVPAPNTVVTKTSTTYIAPNAEIDSQPVVIPGVNANSTTVEKTTVIHNYPAEPAW